jgi:hypothetical protein
MKPSSENKEPTFSLLKVESSSALTPHNRVIFKTGKKLLTTSIKTGKDFCKSMITISTSAIPIYISILGFTNTGLLNKGTLMVLIVSLPALLFLSTAIVFMYGYKPFESQFSLEIIEEIQQEINRVTARINRLINIGVALFSTATVVAIGICLYSIFEK